MKRILLLTCMLFLMKSHAQEMLGIANSNYAGTTGLMLNPSNFVENRLNLDINLLSFGVSLDQDFLYIPKDSLKFFGLGNIVDLIDNKSYYDKFLVNNKGKQFNGNLHTVTKGLSATFHIKDHWIGLSTNLRGGGTFDDVGGAIGKFAYEKDGLGYDPLHATTFTEDKLDVGAMVWGELGVTYGHKLMDKGKNYLKGAVTIKRLWGYGAAWVTNEKFKYDVNDDSTIFFFDAEANYGHAFDDDFGSNTPYKELINGTGWGFDVGFTYEYRPKYDDFRYEMDGQRVEDPTANRYKLKVGLSLTDLGKIHFDKDAGKFNLTSNNAQWYGFDTVNFANTIDFDTTLSNIFYGDPNASYRANQFDMGLPHAISLQVDYNIYKNFYANATIIQRLRTKGNPQVVAANVIGITPRFEKDWVEVALPISVYQYENLRVGIALRLGSFFIGSDKLGGILGASNLGGMDFYTGLKFSIGRKKIKDSDADGVSDKKDKCPKERGTWATVGCPDKDGDGIMDSEDDCPSVAGLKQFKGCPDTDNDGIIDSKDECPLEAGPVEFNGCPDKDGDGIIDKNDKCPDVPGLLQFEGCPDKDNDGITDEKDACPDVAGLAQFNGCPDSDNDGLMDKEDDCPLVAGPKENKGCPVVQKAEVPKEPVKIQLTQEEQEIINKVFKNLEFETGKSVIRTSSYNSLDELVTLLKKKTNFKLLVDGHTDNVGKAASNLKLSQNRANAVKKYLTDRGIDGGRITGKGYGLTKPIADNKTAEGRQRNRRVEFTIVE